MSPKILLVDNGSTKPAATLVLRRLAQQLSDVIDRPVDAVSLQHANKIDASLLHGAPAQIMQDYLAAQLQHGHRRFLMVPLFFSLNRALTSLVPQTIEAVQRVHGDFELTMADVLYPLPEGDAALARIVADNIRHTVAQNRGATTRHVVLVDHGSPSPRVTAVRQSIAEVLQDQLGADSPIAQASMERRPGREYDFNGPLLEEWLVEQAATGATTMLVSQLFLLPGRHAGPGGDIETICTRVRQQFPGLKVLTTPLVSDHAGLVGLLAKRVQNGLSKLGDVG